MTEGEIRQLIDVASMQDANAYKHMVIRMMQFDPDRFLALYNEKPYEPAKSEMDHIEKLKNIVKRNSGYKLQGIKSIREYCQNNGFDKYYGIREAKEFFEANV